MGCRLQATGKAIGALPEPEVWSPESICSRALQNRSLAQVVPDPFGPPHFRNHPVKLKWSERWGAPCLRIEGSSASEFRALGDLADLGRRIAVLPAELLEARTAVDNLQTMPGRFEIDGDVLCFIPRFPFVDGATYTLLVDDREVCTIRRPVADDEPVTRVVGIYPSAPVVPVNLLKLYVYFSAPMSEGWARRAIQVRRGNDGELLRDVFLDMSPELWDPGRTRLTLLLDPGRIKRGLVPNLEAGYPLVEGEPIRVTVDTTFRDGAGRALRESADRRYDVGPLVRARVEPKAWHYVYPLAGSLDPLVIEFDRPLDHALLHHSIRVHNAAGTPLSGRGVVGIGEWSWRFEPDVPWGDARQVLTIDSCLEDLAGNSLRRVFDRDLSRREDRPEDTLAVVLDFRCRSEASERSI